MSKSSKDADVRVKDYLQTFFCNARRDGIFQFFVELMDFWNSSECFLAYLHLPLLV